jgi:pyruvate kinase
MARRTKIIATLGPATDNYEVMRGLIAAGVNLVRINFSHDTPAANQKRIEMIRNAAEEQGHVVGIVVDLPGPKIRISNFQKGSVLLKEGLPFILDASLDENAGDEKMVGLEYKDLPRDVKPDDTLLLDDGRIVFNVIKIDGPKIVCRVKVGGVLSNHKGINRQGGGLSAPALTMHDREDLKIAVDLSVDYIAVSFIRNSDDVIEAKKLIANYKGNAGVIAKIERAEAIAPETLDSIINAADGIIAARGDLSIEIGDAEVPAAQKYMITRARALNKPTIVATQMMESMVHSPIPTRAEVSDVANAILDGTDAVMLSEETAIGDQPVLVVKTMHRIAVAAEKHPEVLISCDRLKEQFERVDQTISMATMYAANHVAIKAIITLTESGITPLWMSRVHSRIPIYAFSRHPNTLGKMALYSNVYPIYFDVTSYNSSTEVKRAAIIELKQRGCINDGDLVIITKGPQEGIHGGTNSLTIVKVGGAV